MRNESTVTVIQLAQEPNNMQNDTCALKCLFHIISLTEPFPKQQILDSSKLKELADDYFKFDWNGRKFSKELENTVGEGEISHYEKFLLSHSVFKMLLLQTRKNWGFFGKGLTDYQTTNLRLVHIETNCRQHFKVHLK